MRAFLLIVAALVCAAPAAAGGWATAGLAPPEGTAAGDTWRAEITVLQHGVTPLEGVDPAVIIRNGKTEQRFAAEPTDEPGVYVAEVTFPSAGTWRYFVDDGFGRTHSFAPVQIGSGGGATDSATVPTWVLAIGVALVLLAIAYVFVRRLRPSAAPAAQ